MSATRACGASNDATRRPWSDSRFHTGAGSSIGPAHRAGLTDVVIPADNEADLDDVPESVREQVRFHPVTDVRQVLDIALN